MPFRAAYFSGDFAFNHSESEYTSENDPDGPSLNSSERSHYFFLSRTHSNFGVLLTKT
jgi:hypothetical protein